MRRFSLLTTAVIVFASLGCVAQTLLRANWQKAVCINPGYMDYVFAQTQDTSGNIYLLGGFPDTADCLGESFDGSSGHVFLEKINLKGEKVSSRVIGARAGSGDIKVCSNGDLVFGLTFEDTCTVSGQVVAINTGFDHTSIIIKTDSNLNVKWSRTFPSNTKMSVQVNWLHQLLLDASDNIYYSIKFDDTVIVGTKTIPGDDLHYQTIIGKLNTNGDFSWVHHFHSDSLKGVCYPWTMVLKAAVQAGPDTLLATCIGTDSIYIDSIRQLTRQNSIGESFFLSTISSDGTLLESRSVDKDMNILFFCNSNGRIFIAGNFSDTVVCKNKVFKPAGGSSIYLGEINSSGDLLAFEDLQVQGNVQLYGFQESPRYGFVLAGYFADSMSISGGKISLPPLFTSPWHASSLGSFIASFNRSYKPIDFKYIGGGSYKMSQLSIYKQYIVGSGMFEDSCYFQNGNFWADNEDVFCFQTTDLKPLNPFVYPTNAPQQAAASSLPSVYPNPFSDILIVDVPQSINSGVLTMNNALGQVVFSELIHNPGKKLISTTMYPAGIYFVKYRGIGGQYPLGKFAKISN